MAIVYVGPTDRFIQAALRIMRGDAPTTFAAQVGFLTGLPTASDGTGFAELPAVNGYGRVAAAFGSFSLGRAMQNPAVITFSPTGAWNSGADIAYFALFDNATVGAGFLWWADQITGVLPKVTGAGSLIIPINGLTLQSQARTITV